MSKARAFPARCGLAILSGLACALAFPPFGWWPLIMPGLVGLLVSIHGHKQPQRFPPLRSVRPRFARIIMDKYTA